jgi:putative intracellular protease/amidase
MIEPSLKIAVYTGRGASHSWIWLVNTLDAYGFRNIQFTDDVAAVRADVLVISGGDPFAIFSHIKKEGVSKIRKFIKEGGTYIGICAGTYFALKFHDNPYPWLNMISGEISNFSHKPPPNIRMPHKYLVPYREGFVFHPVREAVQLSYQGTLFEAPLYGGPGIRTADAEILAVYTAFTEKTLFLCDKKSAENVLLQKIALISKKKMDGQLFLFGPHFEHPYFPEANRELTELLSHVSPHGYRYEIEGVPVSGAEKKVWTRNLRRWVSNGRLAARGLENYYWKIGEKIYDPERLAYFFETCFNLVTFFELREKIYILGSIPIEAKDLALQVRKVGPDPVRAEILLEGVKKFTSTLYSLYFSTLQQLQPDQKP